MRNRVLTCGAAAAAAIAASAAAFITAPPAQAALTTYCVGEAADTSVSGDLVVPAGKSCTLTNVKVKGNVRVNADANLVADASTFNRNVSIGNNGYYDITGSQVGGNVASHASYGVFAEDSELKGNFTARTNDQAQSPGFYFLLQSKQGSYAALSAGEAIIDGSRVGGGLTSNNGEYVDINDSVIAKRLTVTNNKFGGFVCDSEIKGDAKWDGNTAEDGLQIGGDGDFATCAGSNVFSKNVTISNTDGQVNFTGNIVEGKLRGEGNDPAPVGENNRVRGGASGQFEDLQPAGANAALKSATARGDAVQGEAAERRGTAKAEAAKAGKADL